MTTVKYPKHFLVIRDQQFDIGNQIKIVSDLKTTYKTANFQMPSITTGTWSTENFRKYDRVQVYFEFFGSERERQTASLNQMTKMFDGYISSLEEGESKEEGRDINFICKSTAGLLYERSTLVPSYSANVSTIINDARESGVLTDVIPNVIINGVSPTLIMRIDSQKFLGKVFDQIKEKYAVHIYQRGDADLVISTPFFLNNQDVEADVFDLQTNLSSIDYGETTINTDTIIVVGTNAVGIAFDPIGLQLKQGVAPEDVLTSITPTKEELSYEIIYRRDLTSNEECQEVARNILVDRAKNYAITCDVELDPTREVGSPFVIQNSSKVSATQLWIASRIETTIEKNNVGSVVTGYSNSIVDFPDELLLSSTGLLDTDILGVEGKTNNLITLH